MSISGLVVHAAPQRLDEIRQKIEALAGAEIHAASDDGKFVVTIDLPNDRDAADTLSSLHSMDGVLNTSLVYNYFDREAHDEEMAQ